VPPSPPRNPSRRCYIVLGNHDRYVGIVDMVEMLHTYFRRQFSTLVSTSMVPGAINVLIDEFARPGNAKLVLQHKAAHPDTRLIVMATEFVTPVNIAGRHLGSTFNYFGIPQGWKQAQHLLAFQAGLRSRPPYYVARYCGFAQVAPAADLVLCAHNAVRDTLNFLPETVRRPLTLYPTFHLARLASDPRLHSRPPGVVMTGTLTKHRMKTAKQLVESLQRAGVRGPVYQHVPFDPSSGPRFTDTTIDLNYADAQSLPNQHVKYLYNLNPPQHADWAYSSPMRIQRALLLGQIPLVTRKFGDHAIEDLAVLWDGSDRAADQLWINATVGRSELIRHHIAAVARYNAVAERNNAEVNDAIAEFV
jgi:hypothetical protein